MRIEGAEGSIRFWRKDPTVQSVRLRAAAEHQTVVTPPTTNVVPALGPVSMIVAPVETRDLAWVVGVAKAGDEPVSA
ncbi:MAG: hypothetical protein A3I93_03680 [Candidatus Magasanikbacteria bacterium RIFCSPLOWO2_02_FULL_43_22]|nr:MAG: hypothetical protein A3I93_03680 [Candidatus Magasanikbacteria bacterium RIFCSPLOWO2_02_FULL_43_22]